MIRIIWDKWFPSTQSPWAEWEYLVKIWRHYHIGYLEYDWVWTVAGIVSYPDKWKVIDDSEFRMRPLLKDLWTI